MSGGERQTIDDGGGIVGSDRQTGSFWEEGRRRKRMIMGHHSPEAWKAGAELPCLTRWQGKEEVK